MSIRPMHYSMDLDAEGWTGNFYGLPSNSGNGG